MKFMSPTSVYEAVPNLAWIRGTNAVISLYSLRGANTGSSHNDCDFERAIELVKAIDRTWSITHWCFDWTAERDLTLWNGQESASIFSVLEDQLLAPLSSLIGVPVSFIHGDVDIGLDYDAWIEARNSPHRFNTVRHLNRFFYHYNKTSFPCARPVLLPQLNFSTFHRKETHYRKQLLEYLKNNNLLNLGYFNFAFANTSNLLEPLSNVYEQTLQETESEIYKYYRASNFDIVVETATHLNENRRFITEKTLRALALGQPFIAFNGARSLEYLRELGFKTYHSVWDEGYDSETNETLRFEMFAELAKRLITNPNVFVEHRETLQQISEHNQYHFQHLAKLNHREHWFNSVA